MKAVSKVLGALVFGTVAGFAGQVLAEALVPVSAQYVFIPKGFDDNDNIQIVIHGFLKETGWLFFGKTLTIIGRLLK